MKFYKYFLSVLAVTLLFSFNTFAQTDEDMSMDDWEAEMARLTTKKNELTSQVDGLKGEVNGLKAKLAGLQTYEDCLNDLYALVGATKSDVDNFRSKLNSLAAKVDAQESPKDDRQAELDALKANKISALPEFFDKTHNQLQRQLDAWQEKPKEILYTVVKGDHLWGIAKKKDHFDNAFAWPIIYKANRDQIKNPDLIYPKQLFKIPSLTDEEKAHYDKIRANYKPAPLENQ